MGRSRNIILSPRSPTAGGAKEKKMLRRLIIWSVCRKFPEDADYTRKIIKFWRRLGLFPSLRYRDALQAYAEGRSDEIKIDFV
jgi:hypothetical protein